MEIPSASALGTQLIFDCVCAHLYIIVPNHHFPPWSFDRPCGGAYKILQGGNTHGNLF